MKETALFIIVILPFALLYLGSLLRNRPENWPTETPTYNSPTENRKRRHFWAATTFLTVIFTCLLISLLFMIATGKI